ncbi:MULTISPECIES: tRNA (adenosine(37)-N6)-threonylcarbamoyltransferase complex dimerization subunit type 1 TsaB [Pseudoalteromonas]|uniref:tRNA threonylcarbamoyladenosine biosynthesis protein TsaB n=1 Tax=Pseudoalteromonas amylolytica TaxID=1859457 RepID=A0A1S1MVX1_9GAMM|nr:MULTISPECIES: tRNA (adenosine(37)-N6)-threonylcarbamoyltransferase complex dimerization subunit type 1 TsaB [Pseudoalteromonas]OHU85447.1 tRNA (adenosine(37)-N6)-threonylcarbamoyltransferase complex dimerization subunit type 1 TsaB [Pseudoalteromonas sp. JW3]OHU92932.1 tRNA (adenosine(37)-N6)-threonylcarbamoyltransferase complex dimerization subunit type 1 TsaB [Pseudoalteromonas amylolytica]
MKHNLLAIDASTEALSLALYFNGQTYRYFEECPQQHSQKILPQIEQMLDKANCQLKDLDGIVFGRGPGSFTGVRISVAIAQGLAYSCDLPLVGVSTLEAMALQAVRELKVEQVISGIDARMGEIYLAQYELASDGCINLLGDEVVCSPEDVKHYDTAINAVGTAWQAYPEIAGPCNLVVSNDIRLPDAFYMLELGDIAFSHGLTVKAADAQPHYVRDTVTWKKLPGRE